MGVTNPHNMTKLRKQRDLPVTLYRILLYLSRAKNKDENTRRIMRIERAVGIERKELKLHLISLENAGYIESATSNKKGRGGHIVTIYNINEPGKIIRGDIGRFVDLGIKMGYYPDDFFYLPSDI